MTSRALTAGLLTASLAAASTSLAAAQGAGSHPVTQQKTLKPAPWAQGAGGGQRPAGDGQPQAGNDTAWNTQQELWRVMRQYPPAVGEILQRDPSLLDKADYMSAYPALAEFVQQHPEVARNASFYFGSYQYRERSSRDQAYNLMEEMLAGMGVGVILLSAMSVFVWLVKTLVDHRRWLRTSKVQVEMHGKLLDRLTTNEDLLQYAQSPAGSRFLESAPIALDAESRASAPVSRIIWSMQAGVVLIALGVGVRFVAGRAIEELAQALFVMSAIVGSVGVGLLVSALAAYVVSSRLGILPAKKA